MPRLTKIYTRTGDTGQTMLGDRTRAPKTSLRVGAYGDVDEANTAIGFAVAGCGAAAPEQSLAKALTSIQQDLFDVGADLCAPIAPDEAPGARLRIGEEQIVRLEKLIDQHNAELQPLGSFILPGGTELAARLHLARVVTRRAERSVAALLELEPEATNPAALKYLNRLSDLLFVLARVANNKGADDVLWVPGANRNQ